MCYLKYFYKDAHLKLIIEEDTVGFYLVVYRNSELDQSTEDYLLDSLEDAFQEAKEKFGIMKDQWISQNTK